MRKKKSVVDRSHGFGGNNCNFAGVLLAYYD
jgi:hypothetical protein